MVNNLGLSSRDYGQTVIKSAQKQKGPQGLPLNMLMIQLQMKDQS